jgi:HSP20 family molecular chaperone IbpA
MSNELSIFDGIEKDMDTMFNHLFAPMDLSAVFPSLPVFNELTLPLNVYVTKKGNKVIELSVCGKTKDSITVTYDYGEHGYAQLEIQVADNKDVSEHDSEEDKTDENAVDKYEVHKLKKSIQNFRLLIEPKYDMEKIYSKVENGLLTITIPQKEVIEPKKIGVEIH